MIPTPLSDSQLHSKWLRALTHDDWGMMTAIEAEQDRRHAERHPKSAALVARFAEEQYLADRQALFADDGAELVVHDPR